MHWPSVSVVIPVKNEASKIRACLDGILAQSVPVHEIIVIDSGSTDDTVPIIKSYPQVTLIEIPPHEFNHGETRNLGVSKATGEFVLLTVGDARPYDQYWIEELLKGFIDEEVAGVCGQQVVPHEPDKNPVDWFRPISQPALLRYQFKNQMDYNQLPPLDKKNICAWDDVTAMYKRQALIDTPFQKTSYSEDAIWAKEAILKGHAIVYNQKARVYHYHTENPDFVFKRTFTTMYFRYKQFGYLYDSSSISLMTKLRLLKTIVKSVGFSPSKVLFWYKYNIDNLYASVDSHRTFIQSLGEGESFLDEKHQLLCGKPPIPLKEGFPI